MRDEPAELDGERVAGFLRTHWGVEPDEVSYAPVGFGSHHWIASDRTGPRWFLTADYLAPGGGWLGPTAEDVFAALTAAATTCRELAEAGYEFVLAPRPDGTGRLVRRVLPNWALQVFPHLAGWSADFGQWPDPDEQARVAGLVGRLHAATPPRAVRRWSFAVPARAALQSAWENLDRPWTTGPYAEPTRRLLAQSRPAVAATLHGYDELVRMVEADPDPWVVSHGEPHSANWVRTNDGRMYLIDWDTVALAPRERDLTAVLHGRAADDGSAGVLAAYQKTAGPYPPRPAAIEAFRLWWTLAEICGYVALFRQPHAESNDNAESWRNLCHYVSEADGPTRVALPPR